MASLVEQIRFLKDKFTTLVAKHKQIVRSQQGRFVEDGNKYKKIILKYKKIIDLLKKNLLLERKKRAMLISKLKVHLMRLKGELQKERLKTAQLEKKLKQGGGAAGGKSEEEQMMAQMGLEDNDQTMNWMNQNLGPSAPAPMYPQGMMAPPGPMYAPGMAATQQLESFDVMKAKTEIESLREELKNELARSTRMSAEISKLKAEYEELKTSNEKTIAKLQEDFAKSEEIVGAKFQDRMQEYERKMGELTLAKQESDTQLEQTAARLQRKLDYIQELEVSLERLAYDGDDLRHTLNQQTIEWHREMEKKNYRLHKMEQHVSGLKQRITVLYRITRTYDVFRLRDEVRHLSRDVSDSLARNVDQAQIALRRQKVEEKKIEIQLYEKKFIDRMSNIEHSVDELKESLSNHSYEVVEV